MSLVNKTNSQFIQPRIDNRKGVVCSGQSGGGYGSTADSLAASATGGLGKGVPSASTHYNNCDKQSGGGHNYDADVEGFSYGYTKEGAAVAGQLRGSYAPISVNKKTNMCGGKKRRRKSKKKRKRRRKNKTRKSRRKKRTKRRRRKRGGKRRKTRRGGACSRFRKLRRRQRGGRYEQFGSNIPNTPSYSTPSPSGLPWATGPGSFARQINCRDNYNHYKN